MYDEYSDEGYDAICGECQMVSEDCDCEAPDWMVA